MVTICNVLNLPNNLKSDNMLESVKNLSDFDNISLTNKQNLDEQAMSSYKSNDISDPAMGQFIVGFSCPDAFDKANPNDLEANGNDVLNSKELNPSYNFSSVTKHLVLGTTCPSTTRSSSFHNSIHLGPRTPRCLGTFRTNYSIAKFNSIMAKTDRNPEKNIISIKLYI